MHTLALSLFWKFRRLQLPVLALMALLQRTPIVRWVMCAESVVTPGAQGQVLRCTALLAAAVGAVDTLAGATTFSATPASPASATTGTAFTAAFAVTGAPSTTKSYTITNLPPGLNIAGATASGSSLLLNASNGTISGTPTTAGNYAVAIKAWEKAGGTGKSASYSYTINVTGGAAATAPSITTQPSSQSVTAGGSVSFSVTASGTAPLSYQWQKGGAAISGATAATYSIASAATGDAGTYTVVVTNSAGNATSNGATLTVNAAVTAPSITTQPTSQTVNTGSSVSFSVSASGTAPLSYQWQKGGASISGATSATYSIASAAASDAGTYTVVVTNSAGNATSNGATLTVNTVSTVTAPSITTQPTSQTVDTGSSVSFSVTASGTAPLSYQWQKGGAAISGATSATYSIASAATGDAGTYTVVVTNSAGSATSNGATLTVNAAVTAPSITTQPTSQTVNTGSSVSFSVTASGTAPLSYQWLKGGANISGATAATYSIASAATGDAGTYTVVVTNSAGNATSNGATLTVNAVATATAPSITTQPTSQTVTVGGAVSFSVAASGTAPLSYQWQKGGANISGATAATYSIASAATSDAGTYTVVVTNSAGNATSNGATLTVNAVATATAPSITSQPASVTVSAGQSATFTITASGTAPLSYQWRKDGATITGATSASYTLSSVAASDAGVYSVVVTNSAGSVTSNSATLALASSIFPHLTALTFDGSGRLYATDSTNDTVHRIASDGTVYLVAGTTGSVGSANGNGSAARFNQPGGVVATREGDLYVADTANALIRRIATNGTVTTFAGNAALRGNANGNGTAATFSAPTGLALDSSGNLYVADATNHTIRKITSAGNVTTYAGQAGSSGSANGSATSARFNNPTAVAVDSSGNVYVADTNNNTVRKISADGTVTTLAGLSGVSGATDGNGVDALFNQPQGLALDANGNLYVADTGNSSVRKITHDGTVTTVAGLSTVSSENNSRDANGSLFNHPLALAVSPSGTLYIGDTGAAAVRMVSPDGTVTTLALKLGQSSTGSSSSDSSSSGSDSHSGSDSSSDHSSGGGGGATGLWLPLAFSLALAARRRHARRAV
jgi:sugar lactone lactonase YvrE